MKATGAPLLGVIVAVALVGCGSGARPVANTVAHHAAAGSAPSAPGQSQKPAPRRAITLPAPGPTGIAPSAGAVRVIERLGRRAPPRRRPRGCALLRSAEHDDQRDRPRGHRVGAPDPHPAGGGLRKREPAVRGDVRVR